MKKLDLTKYEVNFLISHINHEIDKHNRFLNYKQDWISKNDIQFNIDKEYHLRDINSTKKKISLLEKLRNKLSLE